MLAHQAKVDRLLRTFMHAFFSFGSHDAAVEAITREGGVDAVLQHMIERNPDTKAALEDETVKQAIRAIVAGESPISVNYGSMPKDFVLDTIPQEPGEEWIDMPCEKCKVTLMLTKKSYDEFLKAAANFKGGCNVLVRCPDCVQLDGSAAIMNAMARIAVQTWRAKKSKTQPSNN